MGARAQSSSSFVRECDCGLVVPIRALSGDEVVGRLCEKIAGERCSRSVTLTRSFTTEFQDRVKGQEFIRTLGCAFEQE